MSKQIDIRKGDQFGYTNNGAILVQSRGGQYRTCRNNELEVFRPTESVYTFTPVPDSVARAVLAATGYTVVEVQEEERDTVPGPMEKLMEALRDYAVKRAEYDLAAAARDVMESIRVERAAAEAAARGEGKQ